MKVMICPTGEGGCGLVDYFSAFIRPISSFELEAWDTIQCPCCVSYNTFFLNEENITAVTDSENYDRARLLLEKTLGHELRVPAICRGSILSRKSAAATLEDLLP